MLRSAAQRVLNPPVGLEREEFHGGITLGEDAALLYWRVTSSFDPAFIYRGEFIFQYAISGMFFIILILGELSFQVLSYLKLFDLSKSNNTPLIISAVIAAIGTIVAFGYLLVLNMPAVERIANRLRTSE